MDTNKMKKLKELSKEQIRFVEDYFNKMIELEQLLEDIRLNVTTAKTQNGFALSSVSVIDNREIEPNTLVKINDKSSLDEINRYNLIDLIKESEDETKNDKEQELKHRRKKSKDETADDNNENDKEPETKNRIPPNFRPFGLLEPRASRTARKISYQSLDRICELASIQHHIFNLEKEIKKLDNEVIQSLGDDYDKFLQISKEIIDKEKIEKEIKNNLWLKPSSTTTTNEAVKSS